MLVILEKKIHLKTAKTKNKKNHKNIYIFSGVLIVYSRKRNPRPTTPVMVGKKKSYTFTLSLVLLRPDD